MTIEYYHSTDDDGDDFILYDDTSTCEFGMTVTHTKGYDVYTAALKVNFFTFLLNAKQCVTETVITLEAT